MNAQLEFHFDESGNSTQSWTIQNDNVMGGVSEGSVQWQEDGFYWHGHTRLENNGGFSSIRSPWKSFDLTKFDAVRIRCKGTGGPFKIVFDTTREWYLPNAQSDFEVTEEWSEVVIPLENFIWKQPRRGFIGKVIPSKELGEVIRFGLMKYDGTAQPFKLEVASLTFE
tara:strand:+ start:477 stop:980 length:504 start_codon:yes stop_codon:yes gene_type:complete